MTKVAIIGAGPCGLSMLRAFEQAEEKGQKILTLIRFFIVIFRKLLVK